MDLTTNDVVVIEAIKYVQGQMNRMIKKEKKLLQDITEDRIEDEDTDLGKTNNVIF
jgi:hypothetical protein